MKQLLFLLLGIASSFQALAQTPEFVVKYPDDLDSLNIVPISWEYFDILVFDVENDGDLDLSYMTDIENGKVNSSVFLNNGVGNFSISGSSSSFRERAVWSFGDINGDGFQDLVQPIRINSEDSLRFMMNDGFGNFAVDTNISVGIGPLHVFDGPRYTFLDSDNDGDEDLLFGYREIGQNKRGQGIYKNDGSGIFTKDTTAFMEVKYDYAPGVADFNQDGYVDLVFIDDNNTNNDTLKIFLNDGLGGFSNPVATFWVGETLNILVFDANGDGRQDIAAYGVEIGSGYSFLFINEGNGVFNPQNTLGLLPGSTSMHLGAADFDLDGDQDLVYKGGPNGIEIYLNDGTGDFYRDSASLILDEPYTYLSGSTDIRVADMDGDGDTDIIVGHILQRPIILFNERILTGVEESAVNHSIQLYPNPTQSTLQLNGLEEPRNYTIYTLQGSLVQTGLAHPGETLDVALLKSGMYLLKLETGERLKFVKE